MEFRVFGVVEGLVASEPFDLGRRRVERCVLGLLLLEVGTPVSIERLSELVWGAHPPARPRQAIQVSVSRLRAGLAAAGADRHGVRLVSRGGGYLIEADPLRVDLHRFHWLCARAGEQSDPAARRDLLTEALKLCRGPVLGDVADPELRDRLAPRFTEQILTAIENRVDAELDLGEHERAVAELGALTAEHPLRERFARQLVIALFRCGRSAEALAAARAFRTALVDDHGLDPTAEFVAVETAVLRDDPALRATPTAVVPALLPPRTADFTARDTELDALVTALGGEHDALPICVISGPGGIGKSTLAIHAAHAVADRYPDGQLFADLRGATDAPATASEVLGRFLRAMGRTVPESVDERQDAYRSALAGRRALVVLDDAAGEHVLRALLPGSPTCAVVVTSRHHLSGVVGACRIDLSAFDTEVATGLLARIIGAGRVEAQPEAARRLAELCCGLPLAVRNAGARLGSRPHWAIQTMVDRMADESGRLDELADGELAVRASVALGYRALDSIARRAFRLLGALGVPDFAPWLVAALLDTDVRVAEDAVERLLDARMVDVAGTGSDGHVRFRLHDLHRIFAQERAAAEETAVDRSAAVGRALGGWLCVIRRISAQAPSGEIEACAEYTTAHEVRYQPVDGSAWFEAELPALVVAVERAAAMDLDVAACEVSAALCVTSLGVGNRFDEWWRTHKAAIEAARRSGNRAGEAMLLVGLGQLRYAQDDFAEAHVYFDQAVALFRGDSRGHAVALAGIGSAFREQGRLAAARDALTQACVEFRAIGDDAGLGYSARLAASVELELGEHELALCTVEESLTAYRRLASRRGEALAMRTTGLIHRAMGNHPTAHALCVEALEILTALGDRLMAAYAAQSVVKAEIRMGGGTIAPLLEALDTCREHRDRLGEGLVLRTMGELELAHGRLTQAETLLWQAIDVWDQVDLPVFRARAMRDLASVYTELGHLATAADLQGQALAVFRAFGTRERNELACPTPARRDTATQVT